MCNSRYRTVISPCTAVLVQGGQFCPATTDARLEGFRFGGSFLEVGRIGVLKAKPA